MFTFFILIIFQNASIQQPPHSELRMHCAACNTESCRVHHHPIELECDFHWGRIHKICANRVRSVLPKFLTILTIRRYWCGWSKNIFSHFQCVQTAYLGFAPVSAAHYVDKMFEWFRYHCNTHDEIERMERFELELITSSEGAAAENTFVNGNPIRQKTWPVHSSHSSN